MSVLVTVPETRPEPPRPGRLDNLGPHPRHQCAFCDNDGWVVYLTRAVEETVASLQLKRAALRERRKPIQEPEGRFDEMAPCPHCARGALIEFGAGETPGPWGRDGFWRGRSTADLRRRVTAQARLSRDEQLQHLRASKRTLGFVEVQSVDEVVAEPGP